MMLKTIAALGVIAALGFAPVVAFAQTDTTAPAADTAKPMKHKAKSHKKHTAKKTEAPAEAPKS